MPPMMFMKMRDFVSQHPPRSRHVEDIVEMGRNVVESELRRRKYDAALQYRKNKGTKDRRTKYSDSRAARVTRKARGEEYCAAAVRLAAASAGKRAPSEGRPEDGLYQS
ncbi:hypothetical protein C8Q80DRAFT_1274848 [Daedaleopsis nitida]|nr:hypothetical protein C8Q80DRAFT_1274848 [Daedaleopsis nitida]